MPFSSETQADSSRNAAFSSKMRPMYLSTMFNRMSDYSFRLLFC